MANLHEVEMTEIHYQAHKAYVEMQRDILESQRKF